MSSQRKQSIIVIGSGFGGLSAAIRLAAAGHEVTLFEKRDKPGGRAYTYEMEGFRFDGGPTVITAPYLFDELFALAGKRSEDYIELLPVDPFYRIFDGEGRAFNHWHSCEKSREEVARLSPSDLAGYDRFLNDTQAIFRHFHPFTDQPSLQLGPMLKTAPFMLAKKTYRAMYPFTAGYVKDDFLRRALSFHPLLIGGNPFATPAFYSLIIEFERKWGVHYARGGTGAIVEALVRLFQELGGQIRYQSEVAEILVRNKQACGVRLQDGTAHTSDTVICNGDAAFAYKNLLPQALLPSGLNRSIDRQEYSNSLVVLYFGTNRKYADSPLTHHNLILSKKFRSLMTDVFRRKKLPEEPVLYVHMPTATDPGMAPEGCEGFYVLSVAPHLDSSANWEEINDRYCDGILDYLQEHYLPDLRQHLAVRHNINPLHFRDTLNSHKGAAFATHPSLIQSAWGKTRCRSPYIKNLYFVGASVHPGAGVPAVITSGKIAAQLIDPSAEAAARERIIQTQLIH